MVGHTGIIPAAIKAIETVDTCVGKAVEALKEVDGQMFICADHGNAEQMVDYETGAPFTAHTTNPVPFILVNADPSYTLRENGCLADIIPTLIELMGMEQPAEMTGKSLLIRKSRIEREKQSRGRGCFSCVRIQKTGGPFSGTSALVADQEELYEIR